MQAAKAIKVFNDNDNNSANTLYIELKHIKNLSADALTIANKSVAKAELLATVAGAKNPINKTAYNQDGSLLGIVRDVVLDNKKIVAFVVEGSELQAKTLLSHSLDNLIFNDTNKPIKLSAPKKEDAANLSPKLATPSNGSINYTSTATLPKKLAPSPATFDALSSVYAFLLGKTLSRAIKDNNNNIIANPDSIITFETIELAKNNSKLVQLALYAD